jgi:hypothetical protein
MISRTQLSPESHSLGIPAAIISTACDAVGPKLETVPGAPVLRPANRPVGWHRDSFDALDRRGEGRALDLARIFGVRPIYYGQPGNSWAPQSNTALRDMSVNLTARPSPNQQDSTSADCF